MSFKHIVGGILLSSVLACAWSLDGIVVNTENVPLEGVNITCYNYGGFTATSDGEGHFSIGDEESTTFATAPVQKSLSITKNGSVLNISNPNGIAFKASLMDALGKVLMQQEFSAQNASLDYRKIAGQKFLILKISGSSVNDNYIVSRNALLKAGDPLPFLAFSLSGYKVYNYTMSEEVESDKVIVLEKQEVSSSSSSFASQSSCSSVTPISNSSAKSSSSKVEEVVSCTGKTASSGDQIVSVNVDGMNRSFIMHVPSAYRGDQPVPMVIDFHGIGGSGQGQYGQTQFRAQTDPDGVISLYPDGANTNGSNAWNVGPCCSTADDVKFTREMIAKVKETACIDPKRIYATGFSMGGGMANHLACNLADELAAVAPAAMDLNTINSASCNPARPIPIIMYRSENDPMCVYEGGDSGRGDGLNFLGADANFSFWKIKNGCSGESAVTEEDGVTVYEYSNCMDGVKVVFRKSAYGGHTCADGASGWKFLKQFTLP